MSNRNPAPAELESIVRRIIAYYIDSAEDKNVEFLIAYLGGGKIPEAAVAVLRPILQGLRDSGFTFADADLDALERLREEVEVLYANRAVTLNLLKEAIHTPQWVAAEQAHAARFGLKLLPAGDRSLHLLAHEVALSEFSAETVLSTFHDAAASVREFAGRWYADCTRSDYDEEWDPTEGNQQEDLPPGELLGIGQGFLVSYLILYLYAATNPDGLLAFFKCRKMPQGKKVAADVMRVYRRVV